MKPTPLYRNILISEEIDSSSVKVAINKIMDIIIKVMLFCIYFIEWNSNLNIYF